MYFLNLGVMASVCGGGWGARNSHNWINFIRNFNVVGYDERSKHFFIYLSLIKTLDSGIFIGSDSSI